MINTKLGCEGTNLNKEKIDPTNEDNKTKTPPKSLFPFLASFLPFQVIENVNTVSGSKKMCENMQYGTNFEYKTSIIEFNNKIIEILENYKNVAGIDQIIEQLRKFSPKIQDDMGIKELKNAYIQKRNELFDILVNIKNEAILKDLINYMEGSSKKFKDKCPEEFKNQCPRGFKKLPKLLKVYAPFFLNKPLSLAELEQIALELLGCRETDQAEQVIKALMDEGRNLPIDHLRKLSSVLIQNQKPEEAFKVVMQMPEGDRRFDMLAVIIAFTKCNRIPRALEIIEQIPDKGLREDMLREMIIKLTKLGGKNIQQAFDIAMKLLNDNYHLQGNSLRLVVKSLINEKEVEKALDIIINNKFMQRDSCLRDVVEALVKEGAMIPAQEIATEMISSPYDRSEAFYDICKGFLREGDIKKALNIVELTPSNGHKTLQTRLIVQFLINNEKIDEAYKIAGSHPDPFQVGLPNVVENLVQRDGGVRAFEIINKFEDPRDKETLLIYGIKGLMKVKSDEQAIKTAQLILNAERKNLALGEILDSYLEQKKFKEALGIALQIFPDNVKKMKLFRIIQALMKNNNPNEALQLSIEYFKPNQLTAIADEFLQYGHIEQAQDVANKFLDFENKEMILKRAEELQKKPLLNQKNSIYQLPEDFETHNIYYKKSQGLG